MSEKNSYRVQYQNKSGEVRYYYTKEENAIFAVTDFCIRTGNPRESVISVEAYLGHVWEKTL